jgi:flagellin-like protein
MPRAVSPLVGVVLLVGITVLGSALLVGSIETRPPGEVPRASLAVSVDSSADRISVSHRGGDELDVSRLTVHISVEGQQLQHQPPVPFFGADGFVSGPEGAFNSASPDSFRAGETTTIRVADTNNPEIRHNDHVTVQIATQRSVLYKETITAT